ncbi:TPA: hypothetical protein DHW58_00145 [Patescibacteria group bacterium]|uniref:Uncharacterized protein n=2 Tax=Bacteria division Kazan-3B-28 TaxID=1798534 RepID=A0A0G1X805_UNCK3|nr:MAG: hypothetical protein VE98_C0001G0431 [candidate division Kazan bacterium GW2011_GWA1_50_15]KKW25880.1 MAG: hypothetical protein VE99_C0001G0519 [candidate division Kazan bacterium GW2011_GWC1_52_13]KKW27106.1 MAG: hypothetical protein VF00_C0001G0041 [candidate division Kazan bacterium GW2011_GWB1_52_7]HCL47391.1 hypothetical protein [Patescibacteria group bacterium]
MLAFLAILLCLGVLLVVRLIRAHQRGHEDQPTKFQLSLTTVLDRHAAASVRTWLIGELGEIFRRVAKEENLQAPEALNQIFADINACMVNTLKHREDLTPARIYDHMNHSLRRATLSCPRDVPHSLALSRIHAQWVTFGRAMTEKASLAYP